MILDKVIDDIINSDSKDLAIQSETMGGKTSPKVFETESNEKI